MKSLYELSFGDFAFPNASIADCVNQREQLIQAGISPGCFRNTGIQRLKGGTADRPLALGQTGKGSFPAFIYFLSGSAA